MKTLKSILFISFTILIKNASSQVISSFSPLGGNNGTTVIINGSNLEPANTYPYMVNVGFWAQTGSTNTHPTVYQNNTMTVTINGLAECNTSVKIWYDVPNPINGIFVNSGTNLFNKHQVVLPLDNSNFHKSICSGASVNEPISTVSNAPDGTDILSWYAISNENINGETTISTQTNYIDDILINNTNQTQTIIYRITFEKQGSGSPGNCSHTRNFYVDVTPSESTETISSCGSFNWNNQNLTTSGVYSELFTGANGCDSLANLNLTIYETSNSEESIDACGEYQWNGFNYTSSGNYVTNLINSNGCDSTAILNLTIYETEGSESISSCENYTWNGNTYTSSGTYSSTFTNVFGCDSIATLNLTITQPNSSVETIQVCENYNWNGQTYNQSGIYTANFTNASGCDSIATLNLTITQPTTSSETITNCENYIWNGQTYNQSGTYTSNFTNAAGCDSIAALNLTIHPNPNVILPNFGTFCDTLEAFTLTGGTPNGGVYSGNSVSNNTFNPSIGAGTYEITYTFEDANGCVNFDLSNIDVIACESNIGLAENKNELYQIYPNPASSSITVLLLSEKTNELLSIYSISGQKLLEKQNLGKTTKIDVSNFSKGIYFLEIGNVRQKFVVE